MKISFLINNAYGIGGTIRSTANLSAAFADRHDVEVVSIHCFRDAPSLPFDPRVRVTSLIEMREGNPGYEGDHPLTKLPGTMFHYTGATGKLPYTALQDERIGGFLARTDADVVIATRPDLNGYLARDGRRRYLRVGQEHLSLDQYGEPLRTNQNNAVVGLDAYITVSEADAAQYRAALPDVTTTIVCVPNGVQASAVEGSSLDSRVIVAAGRLIPIKRYDRLISAFAKVAAEHPGWTLRLYGRGPEKARLREQIERLGLSDRAFLMGAVSPIETEWAKGAIAAVSSDMESFGMTIVEAMHCGVPVVATDCPHGPGEIITDGQDGLLVPLAGDVDAFADGLKRLVADSALRQKMAAGAREKAATYAPSAIARRYEALFDELSGKRRRTLAGGSTALVRRLSRTVRPRPAAPTALPEKSTPPTAAHARATAEGGLTVLLKVAELPAGPLDFVLRLRRDPAKREVRLPVLPDPDAPDTGARVTLHRAEHSLAGGRWDCYVAPRGTGSRTRLTARLVEQARLLRRSLTVREPDGVSAWIPYTTADGFLALRTWLRPAHAEVERIEAGERSVSVTVVVHGLASGAGVRAQAVSRTERVYDFSVPARPAGTGSFRFTVPYEEVMARRTGEQDCWDLRLSTADGTIPVGRISGDIVERKKTDVLPAAVLDHPQRGGTRIRPYFCATNDLALSARDIEDD
ncbi:glycosyltransferase family 4 protein [Streptomyces ureilyticus]|uniref:D-inositol 3-phosphate glycosyltransferase n=1 Tax=Streptomyces ureilyticus TaxID=1775131 RepID=A0ABX0E874_9ACTN|nr:glycosyltransferase family 4 protein [Streptomyces ureilyticus]NGO47761.1 glycosyltransferase family 4 protein [Streptomyces ureilyticus]